MICTARQISLLELSNQGECDGRGTLNARREDEWTQDYGWKSRRKDTT